ncbi:MAG: Panacea domain-containing protein [Alphaproteobacteria bacterium]
MANVYDVAKHILEKMGKVTGMKLQKLCYYSQAWSLVWDEEPLFSNPIKAWKYGPVCHDLYNLHDGQFIVEISKDLTSRCENNLTEKQVETIDAVIRDYGDFTAQQLSDLTHSEDPWKNAKQNEIISATAMHEFYSSL